ncbi:MAG: LPS export ABC transporter ATP-binding protein [Legionellales bacterium]|jgi:lipopolysaccharide export system ATP-binding protein
MPEFRAENLSKSFKGRKIVNGVSIGLTSGQIIGLLGPNGAGKTTYFYMLVGLIAADKGQVFLNHQNITAFTMDQRAKCGIGYLPQEPSIFRKLTVAENILAILETLDLNKYERQEKLAALLEEFNIEHIKNNMGISLSGGERRRVEIARAVARSPQFILLDEPFAGVDPISINDIKKMIQYLSSRGIGILITDHNVRETLDICEHAYIMGHGTLIAQGTPTEILNNPDARRLYLGDEFSL